MVDPTEKQQNDFKALLASTVSSIVDSCRLLEVSCGPPRGSNPTSRGEMELVIRYSVTPGDVEIIDTEDAMDGMAET